ncbi:MAG TPA: CHAT domain-containing tetratricopeptide repeat protein [Armatimonadota bacterium]|nr:CHAT domain-containing tetratricopeptide repeat protein [Armatimonadota bacterium]
MFRCLLAALTLFFCLAFLSAARAAPTNGGADAALSEGKRQMALGTSVGYEEAIQDFVLAAADFHALGMRSPEGQALNLAGRCYFSTSQPREALEYFQRALPLRIAAGDKVGAAETLNNIGVVYGQGGQPERALQFYRKALPLRIATGDGAAAAETLSNIGAVYGEMGQPEKALEYFQRALPLLKAGRDEAGEILALDNIGAVYEEAGQHEKALQFFQQALPLVRARSDLAGEAETLNFVGLVYERTGQYQKALASYYQALPLARLAGDTAGESAMLSNIGLVEDETAHPDKALKLYQEALPLKRAAGDEEGASATLSNIGLVYDETGQPDKALLSYQQALSLVKAAGNKVGEANTLKLAAETLHSLGRDTEARKDYEAALSAADAVIGSITQNDLKRSTTETFQYLYQSYINFLLQRRDPADDRRALEVSEKARSRALRDLLAGNRSELPSAFLATAAGSAAPGGHRPVLEATVPGDSGGVGAGLNPAPSRSVSEAALRSSLNTVALEMPDLPVTSSAQAKDFQADEAKLSAVDGPAIVYHILTNDLAIFVVEPSGEIHVARSAIKPADLNALIEVAREQITSQGEYYDAGATRASLRKLYDALIQPAQRWLPAPSSGDTRTLTIVPFGPLLQVPFAALVAPDGEYLVQKYAIRTAPSLTVLRYTRRRSEALRNTAMRPLVFGDPVMPQGFSPLPGAMAEAKKVAAMLDDSHPRVRADASEASFRKLAPAATEIHLATHGFVDELQPRLSGIILSASKGPGPEYERDGYLTVAEVFQLKLNARLVTLSACDTGLGPAGADGVFGLQSAFLTAGAASLLSSLWGVNDAGTAKLMTAFYHQMETDPAHDRAKALRAAQLSLLGTPEFRQPFYWAAFQLTGETR